MFAALSVISDDLVKALEEGDTGPTIIGSRLGSALTIRALVSCIASELINPMWVPGTSKGKVSA